VIPEEIKDTEARATYVIAELLSKSLMGAILERRRFLYTWEYDAIGWLRDRQSRVGNDTMNYWTASFLRGEIDGAYFLYEASKDAL
jgi:hypothetical protein